MQLKSIEEEAADCRKAFEGVPVGALTLHCHHGELGERLIEPAENRIAYILSDKPKTEQALRLRLFRPVPQALVEAYADWQKADADLHKADADWQKAYADWQKAYADLHKAYADWYKADADWRKADADWHKAYAEFFDRTHAPLCPDCPWNGSTIFP